MKKIALFSLGLVAIVNIAKAQKNAPTAFKTTKDGVEYKIIKDVPGTNSPKIGDVITAHYLIKIGDSVMFDSRKMNNNQPIEIPLQQNPNTNKAMDPTEVITMLTPGDSALIRTGLDSNALNALPFAKATDKLVFHFSLVSFKTKEKFEAETKLKAAGQVQADDKTISDYLAKNKIKAQKTASGLYYVITKEGTGAKAEAGKKVDVNYTGKNLLNGEVFDSNIDPQFQHVEPFSFNLGQHQVIAGWDEGIALLNKGAKATLFIPSNLAYGAQSPSPKIPANGILIFDVELLNIQ